MLPFLLKKRWENIGKYPGVYSLTQKKYREDQPETRGVGYLQQGRR